MKCESTYHFTNESMRNYNYISSTVFGKGRNNITKSTSKSTRPCEKVTSIRLDFDLLCTKNLISIVWVT